MEFDLLLLRADGAGSQSGAREPALAVPSYITRQAAALDQFQRARKLDPDFEKQFNSLRDWGPQYKAVVEDEDLRAKLFPKK